MIQSFFQEYPTEKFDTICCTYVLNVVNKETEEFILKDIKTLLNRFGKAYITVRRDLSKEVINVKDYIQRYVRLNLNSIYNNSRFEIYLLEN